MEKVQNYAEKGLEQIAHNIEKVAEKVEDVLDGVNIEESNTEIEPEIHDAIDMPTKDVASLIASVNKIDLPAIYSYQVAETKQSLSADPEASVKDRLKIFNNQKFINRQFFSILPEIFILTVILISIFLGIVNFFLEICYFACK
jgi:hypothetical protein